MSLVGLWSCDKTEENNSEKKAEYWEVGPVGEGHISVEGNTVVDIPFAYCISRGSAIDDENRKTDYWSRISLFDESKFLSPVRDYDQWTAQAHIYYHYADYWDGEDWLLQDIEIGIAHEPFDTMNLRIEVAEGVMIPAGDIAEILEYTRNDGESHLYEPWQNKDYWFWSEYIDTELTMRLRLHNGQTLEIHYKGQMPTPALYF